MNVLLIEDDAELAEDLKLLLPEDIELTWAAGSEAALSIIEQKSSPDAIILDLCLPSYLAESEEKEGFKLLSVLKQRLGVDTPVLVLSALPREDFEAACLSRNARAYLQKPCPITVLVRHLSSLNDQVSE